MEERYVKAFITSPIFNHISPRSRDILLDDNLSWDSRRKYIIRELIPDLIYADVYLPFEPGAKLPDMPGKYEIVKLKSNDTWTAYMLEGCGSKLVCPDFGSGKGCNNVTSSHCTRYSHPCRGMVIHVKTTNMICSINHWNDSKQWRLFIMQ